MSKYKVGRCEPAGDCLLKMSPVNGNKEYDILKPAIDRADELSKKDTSQFAVVEEISTNQKRIVYLTGLMTP